MLNHRFATSPSDGTTAYRYDPLGRLYQVATPLRTRQFLYDGDQLTAEYDGAGALLERYVHGPGTDDPLVWYSGSAAPRWYHADQQGSIVGFATGTTGALSGINAYDEYGIPNPANIWRFQYTGQVWLSELNMYYYKARLYSPYLGRFLQTDPIGYADQVNLYAYVGDDPGNRGDPSGLASLVTLVKEGVKKVAEISVEKAAKIAAKGGNVAGKTKQEAGKIAAKAATDSKNIEKHKGHDLKDPDGVKTGEKGNPHYHTGNGNGGHVFWSAVAATAGFFAKVLDTSDQLFDPFYVTEAK